MKKHSAPPARRRALGLVNNVGVRTALKYGLGPALLAWLVWQSWAPADGNPGLADDLHGPINVLPLLLAGCLGLASVLLSFVRWFVLVRAQDLPFKLTDAVRLGFLSLFWSTLIPGSIGGDVVKAALLAREQDRRTVAVATILTDRLVGLCGLLWLVALLGGLGWACGWLHALAVTPVASATLETLVGGACLLAGGSLGSWLLLGLLPGRRVEALADRLATVPKVGGSLAELWRAVWLYRCRGRPVGLAVCLAVVGHAGAVLMFYCGARTLCAADTLPSLGAHFLIVPLGMVVQAGFPAPDGLGGAELAYGALYAEAGSTLAGGVLASLVQRGLTWALALVGYVIYLRMRPALKSACVPAAAPAEPPVPRAA